MPSVVVYGREGCCLCREAEGVVERVRSRHPGRFAVELRDIDCDEDLLRRYLERIPVIEIDGEVAFELIVAEPELEQRLGIVGVR